MFILGMILGLFLDVLRRLLDLKIKEYKQDKTFEARWFELLIQLILLNIM